MENSAEDELKPSCSSNYLTSERTEKLADEMETEEIDNTDREEEEEGELNGSIEQEEEGELNGSIEQEEEGDEEIDENEDEMESKASAHKVVDGVDLFDDFEFGTNRAEENSTFREDVATDVGGWADGDKVCTAAVNLSRKFICIDYPGVIRNVDKALDTLGGVSYIQKCIKQNHKLELNFRPKDPYCKPVLSSLCPSRNLLLKIRRRRKLEPNSNPVMQYEYQIEVIGAVDNMYRFDKMCDFQYLPVIKLPDGQYKEILSSIKPKIDDDREEYLSRKVPLYLPPFCFSRRETPTNFFFENEVLTEGETAIGSDRKKRFHGVIHRSFNNPDVPVQPNPAVTEKASKLPEHHVKIVTDILNDLFKERPLWIKTAIMARIDHVHHRLIKPILPMVAYYIETGAWRNLWCKFGFDPKKDPAAKIYQTIDFRLRTAANKNQVEAKRGVETPRYIHSTKKNLPVHKTPIHSVEDINPSELEVKKLNPSGLDLTYIFSPDHRPPYRQMRYQVCDVLHEQVQKMLHENDGKETVCTERDGWCIPDFTDMCRDILSKSVEKHFSK
ncbi:General transcription factor 3C polypeptide 5 [Biomphalaria glabrata]|nr:general transcription factor 3C polypeptide 5-like; partial [Biomphalaria glabrata]